MLEITNIIDIIARGGGGGSGGSGGGGGLLALPIIIIALIVSWWKRKQRIKKAKAMQSIAQQADATWSDEVIQKTTSEIFSRFQSDWSNFELESMKTYLTARYYNHMHLVLYAMQQMGRQNVMTDVELKKVTLMGVHDRVDDEEDRFDAEVRAKASDKLVELQTKKELLVEKKPFTEIWHFDRENGDWKLDGISQLDSQVSLYAFGKTVETKNLEFLEDKQTKTSRHQGEKALAFAKKNNFFYNADFGWLLMPNKGILFSDTDFKASDINHHVIGMYKKVLVQFFEYIPFMPGKGRRSLWSKFTTLYYSGTASPSYTVAAASLPKAYSNISLRRRKRMFFSFKPVGMTRVKTESHDFNKIYDLFTDDIDKVNSLELLHPAYIEKMQLLGFKVNLEIANNTLYLYSTDKKADFDQMLTLLQQAFDEMKM